jgi:hypothetical protein
MEIEHFIRYAPLAIGLKPSAIQGEARLRERERIMYSKTITSALSARSPADAERGLQMRASGRGCGSARRSHSPTVQRRAGRRGGFRSMRIPQRAGAAASVVRIARRFSGGRGGEAA